jgi:hypothetical protein
MSAHNSPSPDSPETNVTKLSLDGLTIEAVEALDHAGIKDALQSVLRRTQLPQLHKDHGSHSNTVQQ